MTLLINSWNLVCFSVVTVSAQYWPIIPDLKWLIILATSLLFSFCFHRLRWIRGGLLAVIVTAVCAHLYQIRVETVFQGGRDITITGKVDSFFKEISHGQIMNFSVESINSRKINHLFRPYIKLAIPPDEQFLLGERWKLDVRLKPVYGRLNEAGFDQEKYYVSQHLHANAIMQGKPQRLTEEVSLRLLLHARIADLSRNLEGQPLLMALAFGDRNYIPPQLWNKLKSSGLIHLVAISGLHIGIAFMLGWLAGKPFSLLHPKMLFFPMLTGLFLAVFYAWLAGFSLPTQRALMMCFLVSVLPQLRLTYSRWQILLLTVCIILFFDPFASFAISFWMSFCAVAAIYLLLGCTIFIRSGKLKQLVLMQCMLVLVMIPVSGHFFSGISLISPLYNLIFVPWFTFVLVPLIFLALMVSFIAPGSSVWLLWLADLGLEPVLFAIDYTEDMWLHLSGTAACILAVVVIVWILSPLLERFLQVLLVSIACLCLGFRHEASGWQLDVLDVGHGLAVLISRDGGHILYDTGYRWNGGSIAESVIAPVLIRRGVDQLDELILSHTDSDHAGGRDFIETFFSPVLRRASERLPGYLPCIQGNVWLWKGLDFQVLWPPQSVRRAYNPHSCVIRISDEDVSVLLTGDIDGISEYLLSREGDRLRSDIMLVPHHGSQTSSTHAFVERVQPKVAIASLGKGNQWGMPSEMVVDTYIDRGTIWMDTGEHGQISVKVKDKSWQISSLRATDSQPWYRQSLRNRVE